MLESQFTQARRVSTASCARSRVPRRLTRGLLGALLCLVLAGVEAPSAAAHPGLDHQEGAVSRQLRAAPNDPELRLRRASIRRERGDWRGALADLAVASRNSKEKDPRVLLEEARARIDGGQQRRGESLLSRALAGELGSRDAGDAFELRARLREARGDSVRARADYDAALRAQPSVERYLRRGRIDELQGDLEAAIVGYRAGVEALAGAVVLERGLVRALGRAGRHQEALVRVDALIARSPLAAAWRLERASLLEGSGAVAAAERERLVALEEIEAVLRRRSSALHRLTRARCLAALGRRTEALTEAEALAKSYPKLGGVAELVAELRDDASAAEVKTPATRGRKR